MRVVTESIASVRSIALGFWVRAGSRDEGTEQAGISHFLEHLLFKGTDRFSSREIDELFDAMGAEVNAGTGKETTSVYSRFLDRHLEQAFDVLQDMVLRPAYPDIDSERQVVIEEIAMYEDEPSDKVHDVLAGAIFGDHPLGRPIIGRAEVISSVPVPVIADWHDGHYTGANIVVAAAGNLEHERIVELVEGAVPAAASGPRAVTGSPNGAPPVLRFHEKETEQYHLCLGGPGIARVDERRFALRILDTILGGSTSSRLFQEVREKRGLAYSVYSYASHYVDSGQVALYMGTRPDNVAEAMDVIGSELQRLIDDGVDEQELERARENVKGRTVLSMESTLTRMNRLGSSVLMEVPLAHRRRAAGRPGRGDARGRERAGSRAVAPGAARRRRRGGQRERLPRGARSGVAGPGRRGMINVAVSGAAGRMGQTVCGAVEGADDMALVGRADPQLQVALADVLGDADVVVDFSTPDTALANARLCVEAGVHCVMGTTGADFASLEGVGEGNLFVAPNFAIGAVLMMRFAQAAARHMPDCEIVELHHDRKVDAPSGTAARTAALIAEAGGSVHEPIHSVRLPGLVAHQEVIFGGPGQTLTIRHDSIDRESFMPGVLLAIRRVGELERSPTIGLEQLL